MDKKKIKRIFLGSYTKLGIVQYVLLYALLISISFIFLYPLLQMIVTSFMSLEDLVDPTKIWVPSKIVFQNYVKASQALKLWKSLGNSFLVSLIPSLCVIVSSSLIGYGFARHTFPLKKFWFATVIVIFLLPTILTSIPTYVTYNKLKMLGSLKAFIYPALVGFGLRESIFILIFYLFFKDIPNELFESAQMDGASSLTIFFKISIPLTVSAFLMTFLYSFVWYWNETSLGIIYLKDNYTTLPMAVQNFKTLYETLFPTGSVGLENASETYNQGVQFAGTILSILPLIIVYFFTQKWFVESVDQSGIAGQ